MSPKIMSSLQLSECLDQDFEKELLLKSTTLHVENLSAHTTEGQIYELFGKCGEIKRVLMGRDRHQKAPSGFCFVEYFDRKDAEDCMRYINETLLDDRLITMDWAIGFVEGRQFRDKTPSQVVD